MDYKGASGYIWTRKTIKYALITFCGLVFLVMILLEAYAVHQVDLERRNIESIATDILGVNVTIGGFYPHPRDHSMSLTGIKIGCPPGFTFDESINITGISLTDISENNGRLNIGRAILDRVTVYMAVRSDTTNLMLLLSHAKTAFLKKNIKLKVSIKDLNMEIVILRAIPIPLDRLFDPVDLGSMEMKNVGVEQKGKNDGNVFIEVLKQIMSASYRSAATHSYLQGMETDALREIQASLDMNQGFVNIARDGLPWPEDWDTKQ